MRDNLTKFFDFHFIRRGRRNRDCRSRCWTRQRLRRAIRRTADAAGPPVCAAADGNHDRRQMAAGTAGLPAMIRRGADDSSRNRRSCCCRFLTAVEKENQVTKRRCAGNFTWSSYLIHSPLNVLLLLDDRLRRWRRSRRRQIGKDEPLLVVLGAQDGIVAQIKPIANAKSIFCFILQK